MMKFVRRAGMLGLARFFMGAWMVDLVPDESCGCGFIRKTRRTGPKVPVKLRVYHG